MRAVALVIVVVLVIIVGIGIQVPYSHIGTRGRIQAVREQAIAEVATTQLVTNPTTLATEEVLVGAAIREQITGSLGVQPTAIITQGTITVGVVTMKAGTQVEVAGQVVMEATVIMLAAGKPGAEVADRMHYRRCQAAGRALRRK